ncbi:MAG: hypothetical protein IT487_08235 [Chromatiaceae bacterium]|nr:hypothetical protein [Chromatiaceae bacterium]
MSAVIMGWARAPGPGYEAYMEIFNFGWVPAWMRSFLGSWVFFLCAFSSAILLFTVVFVEPRDDLSSVETVNRRYWVFTSLAVSVSGIIFWFIKGPDPRFSWVFFVIASVTIFVSAISRGQYVLPDVRLRLRVISVSRLYLVSLLFVLMGWALMVVSRQFPEPPENAVVIMKAANGWEAMKPAKNDSDDQCWTHFPCSPHSILDIVVEKAGARTVFTPRHVTIRTPDTIP